MKVAIIGASGFVGKNLVNEFAERGHSVLGISRNTPKEKNARANYVEVDVNQTDKLKQILEGYDLVVSAYNAGWQNPNIYDDFLKGSRAIQAAVKEAKVPRFIVIGGAGSLYVTEGVQIVDTSTFPKEIYAGASAARDYLNELKEEKGMDWAFFSPAIEMHPGINLGRTGNYRLGTDFPVFDNNQKSVLSVEDLAVVIADEAEKPQHHQQRFTAAY